MSNWLTYSPVSGHGNATITLSATTLTELEDRVATIIASNSEYGVSDSVLITQYKVTLSTPLTFEIISGGTIYWDSSVEGIVKTISYSKNDGDWVEITSSIAGTPINVSAGDIVKFKGDNSSYEFNVFKTDSGVLFNVEGNIMSLINSDGFATAKTLTDSNTFYRLFFNCSGLVSAKNLILPATTLAGGCYRQMFYDCTSLATAPALPATTLADMCYHHMFAGCTSLTRAPALPATTLAGSCYYGMFSNCTSLTTAPSVLPASTLAGYCCSSMFYGCTSLTTAPELPATTLAERCYEQMFEDCIKLTTAPELPATTLILDCYKSMFSNCTSLTTAPALPATTVSQGCYGSMFKGCTSLTTAPSVLPATTLADSCYGGMFQGCTKLKQAPELPATTLTERCYRSMFQGCTKLNYIKCLATDISASDCTYSWVGDITSIGTFVKNKNMTGWTKGISGIPSYWTVQDDSAGDTGNVQLNLSGGSITLGTDCSANLNSPSTAFTINGLGICGLSGDTNIEIFGESTYMFSLVRQEDLSAITITYDWSHDSITYLNTAVLVLNFDNGTTSKTANISYNNGFSSTVVDLRDYFTPNATNNVNLTINASIV